MLDAMAFGAHPDDCEISMGGTLAAMKAMGYRVGVCDLTRGEMGTYGTAQTRSAESARATSILDMDARVTLDIPDGNVQNTEENRLKLVDVIRRHTPTIVFTFIENTRHPDHSHCGALVKEAAFIAGLEKLDTGLPAFMPSRIIRFPEFTSREPDFVVDVSDFWETKIAAIRAYSTQVTADNEDDTNTKTFVRSQAFWDMVDARSRFTGSLVGVKHAEPFFVDGSIIIEDVVDVFAGTPTGRRNIL
jgi:bacillithiol biosynthesis deacetylase BshB1